MLLKSDNQEEANFDWLKWLIVVTLLLAGLIANYYYSDVSTVLRTIAGIVITSVAALIAWRTQKGRWVVEFFRESRNELRKVVWPTRQETIQTTLVVAAMVIVLALFLWCVDGVLLWIIGWLTGQRG